MSERFSRNEALFGAEGQRMIEATPVAIVGLGGLGSHVGQQLGYLGTRAFTLVDRDIVTESSLNRVVTAVDADVEAKTPKVRAAERLILAVAPRATVDPFQAPLTDPAATAAIKAARILIGCLDHDIHRLELLGICAEAGTPYLDLATDTGGTGNSGWYGGRIVLNDGNQCLVCLGLLDQEQIGRDRLPQPQRAARDRTYGVSADALDATGPAVVSLNGVVASLAVTEFMCLVTGLRAPQPQLTYRGDRGVVTRSLDRGDPECWYCSQLRRAVGNTDPPATAA